MNEEMDGIETLYIHMVAENKVVAQCYISHLKGDPTIVGVFVRPDYRERGLGRKLFLECYRIIRSQNKGTASLFVSEDNPMVEVYKRWGFVFTGGIVEKTGQKWMEKQL